MNKYSQNGYDTDGLGTGCTACPMGSGTDGNDAAARTLISSCILSSGWYIDAGNLFVPALGLTGSWVPGGGYVGTAGGIFWTPAVKCGDGLYSSDGYGTGGAGCIACPLGTTNTGAAAAAHVGLPSCK